MSGRGPPALPSLLLLVVVSMPARAARHGSGSTGWIRLPRTARRTRRSLGGGGGRSALGPHHPDRVGRIVPVAPVMGERQLHDWSSLERVRDPLAGRGPRAGAHARSFRPVARPKRCALGLAGDRRGRRGVPAPRRVDRGRCAGAPLAAPAELGKLADLRSRRRGAVTTATASPTRRGCASPCAGSRSWRLRTNPPPGRTHPRTTCVSSTTRGWARERPP